MIEDIPRLHMVLFHPSLWLVMQWAGFQVDFWQIGGVVGARYFGH